MGERSLDDKIAARKPRTRAYPALLDGELRDQYDELTEQLVTVRRDVEASVAPKEHRKLTDPAGVTEETTRLRGVEADLVQQLHDLVEQAADSSVTFVIRDIGLRTANMITARARKDHDPDVDPFGTTVSLTLLRASIVEPELTDKQWCELFGGTYLAGPDGRREPVTIDDPAIAQADTSAMIDIVNELSYGTRRFPATPAG